MNINSAAWQQVKDSIEEHINNDPMISDVSINYQIKDLGKTKNYLKLNVNINTNIKK